MSLVRQGRYPCDAVKSRASSPISPQTHLDLVALDGFLLDFPLLDTPAVEALELFALNL